MKLDSKKFLTIKPFDIEKKDLTFKDVEFMTANEKLKIYKNFVSFLNNHFKPSFFKKNMYTHLHTHHDFIAHTNIIGFYSEYFEDAAKFHKSTYDFDSELCYVLDTKYEGKSSTNAKYNWYEIYKQISTSYESGIGEFYYTFIKSRGLSDYSDLDYELKEAFSEYLELWRIEIKKSIKKFRDWQTENKVLYEEQLALEEKLKKLQKEQEELTKTQESTLNKHELFIHSCQTSLFDFL